jgi:hypothetical protein
MVLRLNKEKDQMKWIRKLSKRIKSNQEEQKDKPWISKGYNRPHNRLLDDYQQDQLIEDIDDYLFYSDEWLID